MSSEKYEVRSDNGYRSLYATAAFRQGEIILGLPLLTQPAPDRLSIEAWPGIHLNCTDHPGGAINHSCTPNAAVKGGAIVAWSCIKAGDEIRIDYKRTEQKLAAPFDCHCGHPLCLGRIE